MNPRRAKPSTLNPKPYSRVIIDTSKVDKDIWVSSGLEWGAEGGAPNFVLDPSAAQALQVPATPTHSHTPHPTPHTPHPISHNPHHTPPDFVLDPSAAQALQVPAPCRMTLLLFVLLFKPLVCTGVPRS